MVYIALVCTAAFTCAGVIAGAYIYRLGVREGARLVRDGKVPAEVRQARTAQGRAKPAGAANMPQQDQMARAFDNIMRHNGEDQHKTGGDA